MVDYSNIPRDSRRVPLETRVQFKFDRFSGFLSEYSANISPGGFFLRTRAPQAQGTVLDFEFRLGDGFELINGRGEVVWVRTEDEGSTRPAGMGIRFLELSPGSKELIYRIVDQHILQGGTPFDVTQRPPDSVPPTPVMPAAPAKPAAPEKTALPPLAAAFAASLEPPASAPGPSGDVFDLPPAPVAPRREPEALTPWPPSLDDPSPEPLPSQYSAQYSAQYSETAEPFPDLLTPPEPEPEPEPAAPMFHTTFGAASARQPRRILPWALLAAGLVLAAALFLLRGTLMEMVGLGGEEVVQAAPPPRPRRTAPASPASPANPEPTAPALAETPEPTPEPAPEATPAPADPRGGVEPIPAVTEEREEVADTGPAIPAITRLENITFKQTGGGTEIVLQGDGAIRAESFTQTRIDGNPPRELFRLSGIRRQFSKARVVVGTPEVLQVRVGYHPDKGRGELHVVLDLARPNVVVTGVEPGEDRLSIRLQRR